MWKGKKRMEMIHQVCGHRDTTSPTFLFDPSMETELTDMQLIFSTLLPYQVQYSTSVYNI